MVADLKSVSRTAWRRETLDLELVGLAHVFAGVVAGAIRTIVFCEAREMVSPPVAVIEAPVLVGLDLATDIYRVGDGDAVVVCACVHSAVVVELDNLDHEVVRARP